MYGQPSSWNRSYVTIPPHQEGRNTKRIIGNFFFLLDLPFRKSRRAARCPWLPSRKFVLPHRLFSRIYQLAARLHTVSFSTVFFFFYTNPNFLSTRSVRSLGFIHRLECWIECQIQFYGSLWFCCSIKMWLPSAQQPALLYFLFSSIKLNHLTLSLSLPFSQWLTPSYFIPFRSAS